MKEYNANTFFIDCRLPDGSIREGGIGWTRQDALMVADEIRKEHPDWIVEINAVEKANL